MHSPSSIKFGLVEAPRWLRLTTYWAFWITIAVLNAASQIIQTPQYPKWKPLLWELASLITVGLLYPVVAYLARRFSFSKKTWASSVAVHAVCLLVFSAAHTSGMVAFRKIGYWIAGEAYTFGGADRVLYEFYKDLILYPALIGLTRGIDYYRKYRENELRSAQLQRRLVEAQLQNLRGQLHPHFLFNALNMISERMYENVADADRMITRLSDLLRLTLRSSDELQVPLKTELEILENYLDIMRGRFSDSVQVRMDIDPDSTELMVPSLLLQPLVENAYQHGAGKNLDGGTIEIAAAARNGSLCIAVRDNGPGIASDPRAALQKGIGLSNIAERLRQHYGDQHQLHIANRPAANGGGLEVAIEIPARPGH
jgi:signal transduction histidine kinase